MRIHWLALGCRQVQAFNIPESWKIIDKYFFGKPTEIKGEVDKLLECKLWERVKWYKERGYKVEVL